MESSLLYILKELFFLIVGVIFTFSAWVGRRLYMRVDEMEDKIIELDKSHAVQQAQLTDIKEDIHKIDKKLDKIYDKIK